jgi:type III secretion system OrgA/MxiK family protein
MHAPDALRVLYDPLAYMPTLELLHARLDGSERSAVNALLVKQYALSPVTDVDAVQRVTVDRLISGWAHLPVTAFLLGAHVHRQALRTSPLFLRLPAAVHVFLQFALPLGPTPERTRQPGVLSRTDLLHAGAERLMRLVEAMPLGLWQRMGLALGETWDQRRARSLPSLALSHFFLAHSYASRNPELRRSLGG